MTDSATPHPDFLAPGRRIDASLSIAGNDDGRYSLNLIIVHTPGAQDVADFMAVKDLIAERAPEIEVFIVSNDSPQSVMRRKAAGRPTLVFSPHLLRHFRPARGKVYAGTPLTKLRQVRMLEDAGIPVPLAVFLNEDTSFDPAKWGEFVILKPNNGSRG
jgi:hypothetical protein